MSISSLTIQRAPLGVSVQDGGRSGYLRYGVAAAGPMDWARHAMANRMLDKPADSSAIEVGPAGMDLILNRGQLQISFAGPGFSLRLDGQQYTGPVRLLLEAGQALELIPNSGAMWGYLGIQGRLNLPDLLGSQAENTVNGLGVRKLRAGVRLDISTAPMLQPQQQNYIDPFIMRVDHPLGILPSSQYDHFSEQARQQLVGRAVSISPRFDRMAYQLDALNIRCEKGHDILSDGVTMGAIQVPGDGRPFVLMADHQPTGGYPKIACICKADLPRLAQMAPGKPFRLSWITMERAMQAWTELRAQIDQLTPLKGLS